MAWTFAVLALIGAVATISDELTFPSELVAAPIAATATVTNAYINGFGGDPGVDYEYTVAGHTYTGYGTDPPPRSWAVGASVPIYYARSVPWKSCICNPANHQRRNGDLVTVVLLAIPLPVMTVRTVRRRQRHRRVVTAPPDVGSARA